MTPRTRCSRGFTLVELIVVIVIMSVIALTLALVMRPAIDAFVGVQGRTDLADQADVTLKRMLRDVRLAVPNSIRTPGSQCFELVPASTGGRYRMAADTVNDNPVGCTTPSATCSAPLDTTRVTTLFDSLSQLPATPAVGDWVVVNNQNTNDVYQGVNRSAITSITTPAATQGRHRIGINAIQFPSGYDGGRFAVVPNHQRAVFYVCAGADGTLDANGNGKGTLYRMQNYGFNAAYPTTCPAPVGAHVLATTVKSCSFIYDPNHGATQQSGFIWMDLEITRRGETAHLATGAHVMNAP